MCVCVCGGGGGGGKRDSTQICPVDAVTPLSCSMHMSIYNYKVDVNKADQFMCCEPSLR